MKRGLKVREVSRFAVNETCYNRYPDEKGTESSDSSKRRWT